ncbi:hypothetical protein X741_32790 [Mesorhizobium sp. LNHC229A00]|nr:hypothetical protein X741_32790 [Mesorhizobium sp. LNHC229A00]
MTCGYLPIGLCMIHPLAAAAEQLNEARTRMGCAATSSQLTLAAARICAFEPASRTSSRLKQ